MGSMTNECKKRLQAYARNFGLMLLLFVLFQMLISIGVIDRYWSNILVLILINMILTLSLNVATGFLGELCLGHAGFMALGAYTAAIFTTKSGLPPAVGFPISLVLGMIPAAVLGFLIALPALRLHGDYLAIITLAFGEIIRIVLRSLPFTGGALGMSGIPRLSSFAYAYWAYMLTLIIIINMMFSRHGRAILAIREDEIAAESTGVNTFRYKMIAFVVSAMFAGLAGSLFAHFQGTLAPEKFDYNYSIDIMVMVVFGGMGSVSGSIIAAILLTLLPELLRGMDQYRMFIYALALIILMLFRPEGMFGNKELSYNTLGKLFRKKTLAEQKVR